MTVPKALVLSHHRRASDSGAMSPIRQGPSRAWGIPSSSSCIDPSGRRCPAALAATAMPMPRVGSPAPLAAGHPPGESTDRRAGWSRWSVPPPCRGTAARASRGTPGSAGKSIAKPTSGPRMRHGRGHQVMPTTKDRSADRAVLPAPPRIAPWMYSTLYFSGNQGRAGTSGSAGARPIAVHHHDVGRRRQTAPASCPSCSCAAGVVIGSALRRSAVHVPHGQRRSAGGAASRTQKNRAFPRRNAGLLDDSRYGVGVRSVLDRCLQPAPCSFPKPARRSSTTAACKGCSTSSRAAVWRSSGRHADPTSSASRARFSSARWRCCSTSRTRRRCTSGRSRAASSTIHGDFGDREPRRRHRARRLLARRLRYLTTYLVDVKRSTGRDHLSMVDECSRRWCTTRARRCCPAPTAAPSPTLRWVTPRPAAAAGGRGTRSRCRRGRPDRDLLLGVRTRRTAGSARPSGRVEHPSGPDAIDPRAAAAAGGDWCTCPLSTMSGCSCPINRTSSASP